MSPRAIAVAFACALAVRAAPAHAGDARSESRAQSRTVPESAPRPGSTSSDASELRFAGEVIDGQPFERDLGHGLVFRLNPLGGDAAGGWVIEILAKRQPPDDPVEFSAIATPPYHFYNQRYLAAAYGYSAREAVAITPRKFYFVQSVADQRRANDVVNAALYPAATSDRDNDRVAAEAAAVRLGRGELRILRSRVAPGKAGEPDIIAWLKFEVMLNFSPGLTLQQVLAPKPPSAR